jgi:hypothetical protein
MVDFKHFSVEFIFQQIEYAVPEISKPAFPAVSGNPQYYFFTSVLGLGGSSSGAN